MPRKDRAQDEAEEVAGSDEPQDQSGNVEAEAAAEEEGLVKMRKGEETLHVHPATVKAHLEASWTHA
jgi:hypothetical protein